MKIRHLITITVLVIILAFGLLLNVGCGQREAEGKRDRDSLGLDARQRYEEGYDAGFQEGYDRGYADGRAGIHDPQPVNDQEWDEDFASGYRAGFLEGYEKGYARARSESEAGEAEGGDEMAEVEAAMIAFAKSCSSPGLEFRIQNIVIHGDEAAGVAVCTSERLENALVIVRKGPSGWYGVDFGTGLEPPSWYPYY